MLALYGLGVTLQYQSLVRYPKMIGNPIVYKKIVSYSNISVQSCNLKNMTSSIISSHLGTFLLLHTVHSFKYITLVQH